MKTKWNTLLKCFKKNAQSEIETNIETIQKTILLATFQGKKKEQGKIKLSSPFGFKKILIVYSYFK